MVGQVAQSNLFVYLVHVLTHVRLALITIIIQNTAPTILLLFVYWWKGAKQKDAQMPVRQAAVAL